ncbi:hypothetical protein [Pseudorhodoferax sp. Leaf274]|uniref:hypothetical protein n=1 Tax=Pseudorhodoferax sp. Leaf274 TaxID=1736318 RepID=UPI00070360D7|nr:hypothetical protein [Pseudorhodoferax sp. Leaf274]KQP47705.1 hypothetical protein ASF44_23890 [Pseudorhodoferax sp. Leaf274]
MTAATIAVELSTPQAVDGRPATYQSLWLLVRLLHAHAVGQPVRIDDLRGQVSAARTQRMLVSRAFRDFKAWGLAVGWGEDRSRDPRFLNAERRSQGPFWLPDATARRLRLVVEGRAATPAEHAAFLGLTAPLARAGVGTGTDTSAPDAVHLQDAGFWQQLVAAQQAMRQGRWAAQLTAGGTPGPASALQSMRRAAQLAGSDFQRALVTLNEALLWRRIGDDAQARRRVQALARQRLARHVAGHDYLGAMAAIVSAWCDYTARDLPAARAQLQAIARDPAQGALLAHHPQVRFEWSNLWALACRSQALGSAALAPAAAAAQAEESLQHFGRALAAAFESHSFDAAQHVAANMGMAVWLFERVGLHAGVDGTRPRAIQWIAFSEWLSGQAELQGRSAWNAIYLLRIARGGCQPPPRATLAQFRALEPLTPAALAREAGPLAEVFRGADWPDDWVQVAGRRLAEHRSGARRYPGLQYCGLLLEQAWFAAHAGALEQAAQALAALREAMPSLVASDRAYFREVWNDGLPAELLALEPPPRRPRAS